MNKLLTTLITYLTKAQTYIDTYLPFLESLKTPLKMLWNKGAAIAILGILIFKYTGLGDAPFSELIYGMILIGATIVSAPIIRYLVFPSAAEIAESGDLKRLLAINSVSPALLHYWIATFLSYTVTLVCVSSLI